MKIRKLVITLASVTMLLSIGDTNKEVYADGGKIQRLEQEQEQLEKKVEGYIEGIGESEKEVETLSKEKEGLIKEIEGVKESIQGIEDEIGEQEREIERLEEEVKVLEEEIKELEIVIKERKEVLEEQARGIQTGAAPKDVVEIVITSESLTEVIGKISVINTLIKSNNNVMEEQKRDQEVVKEQKEELDGLKEETFRVKRELEGSKKELAKEKEELDTKLVYVEEEYSVTKNDMEELIKNKINKEKEIEQIKGNIREEKEAIAKEKELRSKEVSTASSSVASIDSGKEVTESKGVNKVSSSGGWVRPANGVTSSEFGYRIHPIYGTRKLHKGIDISGSGSIVAAKGGKVVTANNHSTYGNHVIIDHGGGLKTLYAHMTAGLNVSVGQEVSAGQRLGTMGTTGASTGVHLHFEVHQNGQPVNPRNYVNF